MKVLRRQKDDDFQRLDDDDTPVKRGQSKECVNDAQQARKKSSSKGKFTKLGVKSSQYTPLDGSFPVIEQDQENNKKEEEDEEEKDFSFDAVFDDKVSKDVEEKGDDNHIKSNDAEQREDIKEQDFYFEAVFDDVHDVHENVVLKESDKSNFKPVVQRSDNTKKVDLEGDCPDRPSTPSTEATSCAASTGTYSSIGKNASLEHSLASSFEQNAGFQDDMKTTNAVHGTEKVEATVSKSRKNFAHATPRFNLGRRGGGGKKSSAYEYLDCSPEVQKELRDRLNAIGKLKDVAVDQCKKISKMELSNKAYKIKLKLSRKEMDYLKLPNAELKEQVTQLEEDLQTAKTDAVVSEEEANRMCTALVLIRQEVEEADNQAAEAFCFDDVGNLFAERDEGTSSDEPNDVGDLFAERNEGKRQQDNKEAEIPNDDDFVFDAFNMHEDATSANNEEAKCTTLVVCQPDTSMTEQANDAPENNDGDDIR